MKRFLSTTFGWLFIINFIFAQEFQLLRSEDYPISEVLPIYTEQIKLGYGLGENDVRILVEYPEIEVVQIQFNYLDYEMQDAKMQYEELTRRGISVVVMEPVRGGLLASLCDEATDLFKSHRPNASMASWALRYVASFKNIKLHQVSSLYLAGSGYDDETVAVMFDARRGNYFCGAYGKNNIEDKLRPAIDFIVMLDDNNTRIVYENNFKVNPLKVMKNSQEVIEVDAFVPNYLRIPEAQYNLEHKND